MNNNKDIHKLIDGYEKKITEKKNKLNNFDLDEAVGSEELIHYAKATAKKELTFEDGLKKVDSAIECKLESCLQSFKNEIQELETDVDKIEYQSKAHNESVGKDLYQQSLTHSQNKVDKINGDLDTTKEYEDKEIEKTKPKIPLSLFDYLKIIFSIAIVIGIETLAIYQTGIFFKNVPVLYGNPVAEFLGAVILALPIILYIAHQTIINETNQRRFHQCLNIGAAISLSGFIITFALMIGPRLNDNQTKHLELINFTLSESNNNVAPKVSEIVPLGTLNAAFSLFAEAMASASILLFVSGLLRRSQTQTVIEKVTKNKRNPKYVHFNKSLFKAQKQVKQDLHALYDINSYLIYQDELDRLRKLLSNLDLAVNSKKTLYMKSIPLKFEQIWMKEVWEREYGFSCLNIPPSRADSSEDQPRDRLN